MRHKDRIRLQFSRQAVPYSKLASITDAARLQRLVQAVSPAKNDSVLDVATGPGYVALAFGETCAEVVGVDLTPEMLVVADSNRRHRQLSNVSFQLAPAEKLPFPAKSFDVVVSRLAVHHFPVPRKVVGEMARVCRAGGLVAVEDLVTSEHPERAAYQNRLEKLRDPSHTKALSATGLIKVLAAAGLEIQSLGFGELTPEVEQWLTTSGTPEKVARKVRAMLARDEKRDLSGICPFRVDGCMYFHQKTLTVVGRKL
ncbi:MAG TPA: class I SAM-dependent methyltransferase [Verrucomicrobiae bacterium]|nr:class I SAM-dependent methyltransferase [Verrucomicrobiae bacterium]